MWTPEPLIMQSENFFLKNIFIFPLSLWACQASLVWLVMSVKQNVKMYSLSNVWTRFSFYFFKGRRKWWCGYFPFRFEFQTIFLYSFRNFRFISHLLEKTYLSSDKMFVLRNKSTSTGKLEIFVWVNENSEILSAFNLAALLSISLNIKRDKTQ